MRAAPRPDSAAPRRSSLTGLCCATRFALALLLGTFSANAAPMRAGATVPALNFYGVPGLIDMPSALMQPDGELSATISRFASITRITLDFQISDRLAGSFRYTGLGNWNADGFSTYYDRSFDLRFRLLDEGPVLPALSIGLQDVLGTGLYSAEYLVATRTVTPRLRLTGGLGWGRLGSSGAIGTPFGPRPRRIIGTGGRPDFNQWFRGPVAPFFGAEWQVTDRLAAKLEYSPDIYATEDALHGIFHRHSPWNFGLEYQDGRSLRIGAYALYGARFGMAVQLSFNPRHRPNGSGIEPAPPAVMVRPARTAAPADWSTDWTGQANASAILRRNLSRQLSVQGIVFVSLALAPTRAEMRVRNLRFDSAAEMVGRVARILTRVMPASIETFEIVPMVEGMATAKITLERTDIETFENAPGGSTAIGARMRFSDAARHDPGEVRGRSPIARFSRTFGPYARFSFFDPDNPLRVDFGARLGARYEVVPGLVIAGAVQKKIVGNLASSRRLSTSGLPHVRSDAVLYDRAGNPSLTTLTLAYYARPGRNLYSRLTLGYLEPMYAGLSAELLWKPVSSRLALGVEIDRVRQRAFSQRLLLRPYRVTIGHASLYYQLGRGYYGQIDTGRYLAGDWGATVSLGRAFANGWRIDAFVTLTNVSASRFGEGSFDKGIRITVPLSWFTGKPSRTINAFEIHPLTRDGGAQLHVPGRLYELVRSYHQPGLAARQGRFWR